MGIAKLETFLHTWQQYNFIIFPQKSSKPCKTLFIDIPLIQKMYKGIRKIGGFKGCLVS
jgi:hypothetical protein